MDKYMCPIQEIIEVSDSIQNDRLIEHVMLKVMEEVGELSNEVNKKVNPVNYRQDEGDDGILGEGVDAIIAIVDMLRLSGYGIDDIKTTTSKKLDKWKTKSSEVQ